MAVDDGDPYLAPVAPLTVAIAPHELQPADRLLRLGAVIIDALLGMVLALPLMAVALYQSGVFTGRPAPWFLELLRGGGLGFAIQLGIVVAGLLLFLALQGYPLARYGQTWAKRWLRIRIVDLQGRKPDFGRMVALRYAAMQFIGAVPCVGVLFVLTDALFIFREDQRCLHDLMAGTRVVRGAPD